MIYLAPQISKRPLNPNATDMQGGAQDAAIMNDTASEQESDNVDSAADNDGDDCAAAESEEGIVDETLPLSLMKNQTRFKSLTVVIPYALICFDFEDELHHAMQA